MNTQVFEDVEAGKVKRPTDLEDITYAHEINKQTLRVFG
jgi:hypothetical protein